MTLCSPGVETALNEVGGRARRIIFSPSVLPRPSSRRGYQLRDVSVLYAITKVKADSADNYAGSFRGDIDLDVGCVETDILLAFLTLVRF